jgi:hypothetical protein
MIAAKGFVPLGMWLMNGRYGFHSAPVVDSIANEPDRVFSGLLAERPSKADS